MSFCCCSSKANTEISRRIPAPIGISVHYLRDGFLREVKEDNLSEESLIYEIENLGEAKHGTIRRKGKNVICPRDGKKGAAYVDCLEGIDNVGPSTFMLSYGWGYSIGDIIDTLESHCETEGLDLKRTYVWICCLCNNQHRVYENKVNGIDVTFAEFRDIFFNCVISIGTVLAMMSPWNDPFYLTRVWCIFELHTASVNEECEVKIVMPPREQRSMINAISDINVLFSAMANTNIGDAQASEESDRQNIMKLVEEKHGVEQLNTDVNKLLREWVMKTLVRSVEDERKLGESAKYSLLCFKVGRILRENGDGIRALEMLKRALQVRINLNGENHEQTSKLYNELGGILSDKGDMKEALTNLRKALDIQLKVCNQPHADTAETRLNIGNVLKMQDDMDGALDEYRLALNIQKQVYRKGHPSTARTHNNMGNVFQAKGEFSTALKEYKKALQIKVKEHGDDHPSTATSHVNIGNLCSKTGDFNEALSAYERALKVYEKVHGSNHPLTLATKENINIARSKQEDTFMDNEGIPEHLEMIQHWSSPVPDMDLNEPEHVEVMQHWSSPVPVMDLEEPKPFELMQHWSSPMPEIKPMTSGKPLPPGKPMLENPPTILEKPPSGLEKPPVSALRPPTRLVRPPTRLQNAPPKLTPVIKLERV